MQGSRNIDILMHIRDYCAEINHTMDTFGRDYYSDLSIFHVGEIGATTFLNAFI